MAKTQEGQKIVVENLNMSKVQVSLQVKLNCGRFH